MFQMDIPNQCPQQLFENKINSTDSDEKYYSPLLTGLFL